MTQKQAAAVWRAVRAMDYNAVARHIEKGELAGEHVVEIEPAINGGGFTSLLELAAAKGVQLSYGTTSRRVVVLS